MPHTAPEAPQKQLFKSDILICGSQWDLGQMLGHQENTLEEPRDAKRTQTADDTQLYTFLSATDGLCNQEDRDSWIIHFLGTS